MDEKVRKGSLSFDFTIDNFFAEKEVEWLLKERKIKEGTFRCVTINRSEPSITIENFEGDCLKIVAPLSFVERFEISFDYKLDESSNHASD
ncbi:hypothetical protein [Chryseobacterium sp. JV274]|uniref:hypothetical protein n=1 Tax=Chryseobacterium sp. JV274 TaxID=1932669 RepID=UPI0015C21B4B|nr:hypothetical protein [Chryseobacterium sp. JV274]CAD0220316.1 protein of unknown function [Chryseobacterium sp. JV274]